jgi:6-phosphogluconolactonase (cycloisomerase 2 family)
MAFPYSNVARIVLSTLLLAVLSACGGGSDAPPPPPTYSIGGTVSGLDAGQSVVLQDNGGGDLTVSANVAFRFATKVTFGGLYAVTISAQPSGGTCTVTGGSGTASNNVTGVAVACVSNPTVTIGGTVSGLGGQGLTLELASASHPCVSNCLVQDLVISANGHFVFPTPVVSGHDNMGFGYFVRIRQQPASPVQFCVPHSNYVQPVGTTVPDLQIKCGEFAYVAHATDNTISAFSVDATAGTIASFESPVQTGLSPSAIAGTGDKAHLYVANSGSNDVSAFDIDPATGALTTAPGSPFAAGTRPLALAIFSAHFVYVANAGSDSLSAYEIHGTNAVLTPMSPASYATGSGPSAIAIDQSMTTGANFLYTANTGGSNDISAFQLDSNTGALTPIAGSPFHSVSNVSSLALGTSNTTSGAFLYAATAVGSTAGIYGFSVDPSSGVLASLPGFPFQLTQCSYIATDRTGTRLYATAGTSVFGFSIDQQTGALSLLPSFPVAVGANADSMSIDPANQFLYVRNGSAGTVTGFELNAATGALTPMLGSPFAVGTSADYFVTL